MSPRELELVLHGPCVLCLGGPAVQTVGDRAVCGDPACVVIALRLAAVEGTASERLAASLGQTVSPEPRFACDAHGRRGCALCTLHPAGAPQRVLFAPDETGVCPECRKPVRPLLGPAQRALLPGAAELHAACLVKRQDREAKHGSR